MVLPHDTDERLRMLALRISPTILRTLDESARRARLSRSEFIRRAIARSLD